MGTSLTGLTPATTYDALIKVGDNGPLSATAKVLSDGLGNDSALAMSTAGVGIGTTSITAVGGTAVIEVGTTATGGTLTLGGNTAFRSSGSTSGVDMFYTANAPISLYTSATERMRITGAGNVGIGTTSPSAKLTVVGTGEYDGVLIVRSTGSGTPQAVMGVDAVGSGFGYVGTVNNIPLQIRTNDVTRLRVDADGLKFGSDTAAANALDDYEEGTWTMGIAFGGGSTGITYSINTGTYTKIGRQVTVNGYIELTSKGSSTGDATITGLPFTIANNTANFSSASLWFFNISFANQFQGIGIGNSNEISLREITEAGVQTTLTNADFANNSHIIVSLTYFV